MPSPLPGSTLLPPADAQDESEHDRQRRLFNQRRRDVHIDRNVGELKERGPNPVRLLLPKCAYMRDRAILFTKVLPPAGITAVMPIPAPLHAEHRRAIFTLMVDKLRWHPCDFDAETQVHGIVAWDFSTPRSSLLHFLEESFMDRLAFQEAFNVFDEAYRVDDFRDLNPDSLPPQKRER